ncbi:unnamed protein product [Fusarium graminearum]|nr:unnamed protein product [Fusarium graminearum]
MYGNKSKILEKGMGNRGSKSTVFVRKLYTVVKEQRVDGSCNGLDLQTEMVHSLFLPLKRNQYLREYFFLCRKGNINLYLVCSNLLERANLNKGLPKVVEEEYPDLKPAVIPELKIAPTINPD